MQTLTFFKHIIEDYWNLKKLILMEVGVAKKFIYCISANSFHWNFFFKSVKCRKFQLFVAIIFHLCYENLNTFLFKGQ